jgi:hypothetical protein
LRDVKLDALPPVMYPRVRTTGVVQWATTQTADSIGVSS